jgi:hypothetical protein
LLIFVPEDEWAFDLLYCVAFLVMDKQWLEKNATYMDFNVRVILISTNGRQVACLIEIITLV